MHATSGHFVQFFVQSAKNLDHSQLRGTQIPSHSNNWVELFLLPWAATTHLTRLGQARSEGIWHAGPSTPTSRILGPRPPAVESELLLAVLRLGHGGQQLLRAGCILERNVIWVLLTYTLNPGEGRAIVLQDGPGNISGAQREREESEHQ